MKPVLESDASASLFADMKKGHELRSNLSEITNGLNLDEKISVIFLLCNEPEDGLQIIDSIFDQPDIVTQNNLFYKWMKMQSLFTKKNWRDGFAELLTIIQNYKLAKILGYNKTDLKERFMPKNNLKSFSISNIRKVLYNLSEELTQDMLQKLVTIIESAHDRVCFKFKQNLEIKLLLWSEKNIINLKNRKGIELDALIAGLNKLSLNNYAKDIEVIAEKTNCHLLRRKSELIAETESLEYYQIIDIDNIGLCVIINEKNFTHSLFPKRWGTDKDVERLIEVFTAFGFNIKLHIDLTQIQLISTLEHYAKTVDKNVSFFVLIILSHGSENVIYTSDSLPVDMNQIEMIFQAEFCQSLIGKPKIFIVQSCQGEKWQKVLKQDDPQVESDNIIISGQKLVGIGPQKGDSMIAWSTVQGFASFRDRYNGSWYIQELCNELWKYGDALDLVEILTRVNNNLRSKMYGGQFMVPSLLLSLRAKIKFPHLKENFTRGRRLMLERLIFDKYFRDFVIKNAESEFGAFMKS